MARVHDKLDKGYTFHEAMTYAYKAILSSPHFLLLLEPGAQPALVKDDFQSTKLDDYALAARLSYFLWSTGPDQELLDLAAKRELTKPDVLRSQVERMLASPKSHQFTENFVGQWLDLRKIDATIPDPRLYADFDRTLLWAMPRETYLFFEEVLKNDRSLLEFVDSDWTMLNERLAKLYGIPGVIGNDLRKVTLPPGSHRGGVMTQASVLKVTADGTRTSPVLRGKWVLERIIGKPPAPPPPDVPAIEPDIRGATTIRQQLDKHRTIAACARATCTSTRRDSLWKTSTRLAAGATSTALQRQPAGQSRPARLHTSRRADQSIAVRTSRMAARPTTAASSRTSMSTRNCCSPTRTSWPAT